MTAVSNPYLSQIERGLSEPSARVLKSIAEALNISAEALFAQAGLMTESNHSDDNATETALRMDTRLTEQQKRALLGCTAAISQQMAVGQRTIRRNLTSSG